MNTLEIKPAGFSDIPVIYTLAGEIWWDHYPGIITNGQIAYMLDKMYSPDALRKQMEEHHHFYLAQYGDKAVGYFSYSEKETGSYFLNKLYIKTSSHRTRLGKSLLDFLCNILPKGSKLSLTVNRKNFKAINFYFKNGFTIQDTTDIDIGNGYIMEDFIMIKNI